GGLTYDEHRPCRSRFVFPYRGGRVCNMPGVNLEDGSGVLPARQEVAQRGHRRFTQQFLQIRAAQTVRASCEILEIDVRRQRPSTTVDVQNGQPVSLIRRPHFDYAIEAPGTQ